MQILRVVMLKRLLLWERNPRFMGLGLVPHLLPRRFRSLLEVFLGAQVRVQMEVSGRFRSLGERVRGVQVRLQEAGTRTEMKAFTIH